MLLKRMLVLGFIVSMMLSVSGCQFLGGSGSETPEDDSISFDEGDDFPEDDDLFNFGPVPPIKNYRPISVTMSDGLKVVGTLYVPGMTPFDPKTSDREAMELGIATEEEPENPADKSKKGDKKPPAKYPLVVLLHMISGDRWDWKDVPKHLVGSGYAVLTLDLRGHGESIYHGKRISSWRHFDKSDWRKMPDDIKHVIDAISRHPEYGASVNTSHIGIIGGSIGANVGVNFASKFPKQVKFLVLLSPGEEYYGVETFNPLLSYENAVYFLASKEDAYSSDSAEKLYKYAIGKKKITIFQNLGHGTDMLERDPDLIKGIISWAATVLPPVGGKVPEEPEKTAGPTPSDKDAKDTKDKKDTKEAKPSEAAKKEPAASAKPGEKPAEKPDQGSKPENKPKPTPTPDKKEPAPKPSKPAATETKPPVPTTVPSAAPAQKPMAPKQPTTSPPATSPLNTDIKPIEPQRPGAHHNMDAIIEQVLPEVMVPLPSQSPQNQTGPVPPAPASPPPATSQPVSP